MTKRPKLPAPGETGDGAARGSYHHGSLRAALLAAAEEELAENGVDGFSLRGAARRAGVSHAAPAHHFGNADALLAALASLGFERLTAAMERAMAEAGDDAPRARLAAAGRGYLAFARADPHLFRLMFLGGRPRHLADCDDAPAKRAFGVLRGLVEAMHGPGAGEAVLARDIAAAWALVHGLSHLLVEGAAGFLLAFGEAERERIVAAAVDRLTDIVGPGVSAPRA